MPFEAKEESLTRSFITHITDKEELEEMRHIESRLDPEETELMSKKS